MKVFIKQISTNEDMYTWAMEQLCIAFPASERRDDDVQRQAMGHSDYRLCAIMDGDTPVGVVGFWDASEFIYFENFCISSHLRNKGYGSTTLQLLSYYAQHYAPTAEIFQSENILLCVQDGKIVDLLCSNVQPQKAETSSVQQHDNGSNSGTLNCTNFEDESIQHSSAQRSFILEIELPVDELTCRRKAFYCRNGMVENPYPHIQPHYRPTDEDLPLMVLTYAQQITPEQYARFRKYLDDYVDVR